MEMHSWMDELHKEIASKSLRDLTIPGSHASGTYGMIGSLSTQGIDVVSQLAAGARYLDLEVTWNKNSGLTQFPLKPPGYYLSTGDFVSSNELGDVMEHIWRFLGPKRLEVLIVSVRLTTRQGVDDRYERLGVWNSFKQTFGNLLVDTDFVDSLHLLKNPIHPEVELPWWEAIGSVTLDHLWSRDGGARRLVIISGDADVGLHTGFIFPRREMRWDDANEDESVDTLLKFLDEKVMQPPPLREVGPGLLLPYPLWFLGTQLTLRSSPYLHLNEYTLLKDWASYSTPKVVERLGKDWRDKPLNIVAGDWIHQNGFCEAVINHNRARV